MTVKELRKLLAIYDDDAEVTTADDKDIVVDSYILPNGTKVVVITDSERTE